ncbi:uncharacterized protein LOC141856331 [Brevipalpus obovatus]|uniref:uncharacterized protein LOC141856331 n=1 Tax=Brevipalpus obovatus TaxID=246614 RepID=UPI003D9F45D4
MNWHRLVLNLCAFVLIQLLTTDLVCGQKREIVRLEASLKSATSNVHQIISRVKLRTGIKNVLRCIRPKRRTVNKEIVIFACKLERALSAFQAAFNSAKRTKSPELLKLAREQQKEVDHLIVQIESVLNF